MIREDRVALMTKMAIFEQSEGEKCLKIARYRRHDYVVFVALGQFVVGTIMYFIAVGGYAFTTMGESILELGVEDMKDLAFKLIALYLIFIFAFLFGNCIKAGRKYDRCRKKMQNLESQYQTLGKMYKKEAEATGSLEWLN